MVKKSFQFLKRTFTKPEGLTMSAVGPVSRFFGEDRGTPIDRYYIEMFLSQNAGAVKGSLLEIAQDRYMSAYGSNVVSKDVLHPVEGAEGATLIADLTKPHTLPDSKFDCFICTQTIQLIYKYIDAVHGAYKLLKPGGAILATLPGITQVSRFDMDRWGDCWRFTQLSAALSFEEVFGKENVEVKTYGNCFAAVSLLRGLSVEEVDADDLETGDQDYPVIIGVKAIKKK